MPTALVTGVTGQDGGYLAEQLTAGGVQVHGVLRPGERVPKHLHTLGGDLSLTEVDLGDDAALRDLVDRVRPKVVYNLVGMSSVARSWEEPVEAAQVNGLFVTRLVDLLWRHQEESGDAVRVVQASSAEVFAGAATAPQDEDTPLSPRSPYGASKAFAHQVVQVYRARGMHASNAVLYNHESPRRPTAFVTRKITSTVAAIADGRATELVLGNLDARRDWGWAPDYVDALVRMAAAATPDDYVVATGTSHTVRDFVAAAFAAAGITEWQQYVRTDPAFVRPVDAVELVGDPARARQRLGWAPRVGFAELVGRMVHVDQLTASDAS